LVTPEQVRATLQSLVAEHGESLAGLSRMIRRSDGYLSRFIDGGSPVKLLAKDRLLLAKYFGIDERQLGAEEDEARAPWTPPKPVAKRKRWVPWWGSGLE
jgi:hypothetical protein